MFANRKLTAIGFLAPAIVIYGALIIYPLIRGAYLSLTDSRGGPVANFIGLQNFAEVLTDPLVLGAFKNTIIYAVVVVVFQTVLGVALARAIFSRPRWRRPLSIVMLLPTLVAPVLAGFIFSYIYAPDGLLNRTLDGVGLGGLKHIWLGDPSTALMSVAAVNVWMFAGYSAVIFLAGYLSMPGDLIDAAQMDGAVGWKRFALIEWPLLAPSLTVNTTLSLIGSLRVFEFPLVLTNGGPANSTQTLSLVIFQKVFSGGNQFAYAVSISILLLLTVVIITASINRALQLRERRMS